MQHSYGYTADGQWVETYSYPYAGGNLQVGINYPPEGSWSKTPASKVGEENGWCISDEKKVEEEISTSIPTEAVNPETIEPPRSLGVAVAFVFALLCLGSLLVGVVILSYKIKPDPELLPANLKPKLLPSEGETYKYAEGPITKLGDRETYDSSLYTESNPFHSTGIKDSSGRQLKPDNFIDKVDNEVARSVESQVGNIMGQFELLQSRFDAFLLEQSRSDLARRQPGETLEVPTSSTKFHTPQVPSSNSQVPNSTGPTKEDISGLTVAEFKTKFTGGSLSILKLHDTEYRRIVNAKIMDFLDRFDRQNMEFCVWYVFGLHKTQNGNKAEFYSEAFRYCQNLANHD